MIINLHYKKINVNTKILICKTQFPIQLQFSARKYFSHFPLVSSEKKWYTQSRKVITGRYQFMFVVLAGGLLIILIAVVIAVISSVTSAVAAETDSSED